MPNIGVWIDGDSEFQQFPEAELRDKEILEIGCGDGRITSRFVRVAKYVTAMDPNEKILDVARNNLDSYSNVRLIAGKGERLDLPDNSFDVVFYTLSFHHIPLDKQYDGILESRRVLRKNGRLFIYEPVLNGQMQSLFLLFEDEVNELRQVPKTLKTACAKHIFKQLRKHEFSIHWSFDDINELFEFFKKEYGADAMKNKKADVISIVKDSKATPLIIEDRLMFVELGV